MSETTFFPKLRDEYVFGRLFTPGNCFCFEAPGKKIMYVALDPRQEPPEHGIFWPKWISVRDELPKTPAAVLVCVQWKPEDVEVSIGEYWDNGEGWGSWDRFVTHWMPLPEPPEV